MKLKIGIVGAGGRVRNTILPAVYTLGNSVELVRIATQSKKFVSLPNGTELQTSTVIDDNFTADLDLVIVAVGTGPLHGVIKSIQQSRRKKGFALMLDTPPIRFSKLAEFRTFSGIERVFVGEDWVRMSPILAMKRIVESGKIGQLKTLDFDRMWYRYHGLATAKELASTSTVRRLRRKEMNGQVQTLAVLGNGVRASSVEPRDYKSGRILLVGTKGHISEDSSDITDNQYLFDYSASARGWYQPFSVNGEQCAADPIEKYMETLPLEFLEDKTRVNLLKIRGYSRLIEEVIRGDTAYPIGDGIYDYLMIILAERLGFAFDLVSPSGKWSLLRAFAGRHG